MKSQELLAVKNSIRELVRKRPGYRNIGVIRDNDGPQVLIDIEQNADLENYGDVIGVCGGVLVRVRRVEGIIRANKLRAG